MSCGEGQQLAHDTCECTPTLPARYMCDGALDLKYVVMLCAGELVVVVVVCVLLFCCCCGDGVGGRGGGDIGESNSGDRFVLDSEPSPGDSRTGESGFNGRTYTN